MSIEQNENINQNQIMSQNNEDVNKKIEDEKKSSVVSDVETSVVPSVVETIKKETEDIKKIEPQQPQTIIKTVKKIGIKQKIKNYLRHYSLLGRKLTKAEEIQKEKERQKAKRKKKKEVIRKEKSKNKEIKKKNEVIIEKPIRSKNKKETKYFNLIKGYIPKYNAIINNANRCIIMLKCINTDIFTEIINNMDKYYTDEVQISKYNNVFYISLKLKETIAQDESAKEKMQLRKIKEITGWLWNNRKNNYTIMTMGEILDLLREKIYATDVIQGNKRYIYINKQNNKNLFQSVIQQSDVEFKNNLITFNKAKGSEIKHQIIGLQMYPSFLYSGYMTEINEIKNVETTTYIKKIDTEIIKMHISREGNNTEILRHLEQENENKKTFNTSFFIHIWGTDEEIVEIRKKVFNVSNKYHLLTNEFTSQQKEAYDAFLPLMNNKIKLYRATNEIEGILPANKNISSKLKKIKYGKELFTGRNLYYDRQESGIILSSNFEEKKKFLEKDIKQNKNKEEIDFLSYSKEEFNDIKKDDFSRDDLFILFKMWTFLCLGGYKEGMGIDNNDKETLDKIFKRQEKRFLNVEKIKFNQIKENLYNYLQNNNPKMFRKISKMFDNPTDILTHKFALLCKVLKNQTSEEKKYIYIYNIQEILDCLDIFMAYIFNRTDNNIYLLSSNNDFMLLNNKYVARELFNAPYINMVAIKPNDLAKIDNYLSLSEKDIANLNDNTRITGKLLTRELEFCYYNER